MSAIDCAGVRERAPELALGVLHGAERAEALLHLATCSHCQALVTELTEVADALPLAVPEVEPSRGFDTRVLSAMRGDRRRVQRRRVLVLAATAAAAAIVSITLVRIIDAGRELPSAAGPALRSVAMRSGTASVGRVVVSAGNPASLLVNVDYAVPDGEYGLQLAHPGGQPRVLGHLTVAGGRGAWRGKSAMPRGENVLTMVDAGGTVVCDAVLTAASLTSRD
jgi:anti-sigma factor RsiW